MSTPSQQAREALGLRLRELRKDGGLTQRRLAELAGWVESKVSKIEHGRQTPSEDDIRLWCRLVGAEAHIADLIATVRNIDSQYLEWRRTWRAGGHRRRQAIAAQEEQTSRFRIYEPLLIPGLLQTPEYARTRFAENIAFHRTPNDLDAAVEARMRRQEILRRGDRDRRFHILIGEAALTLGVADDDVLLGQLDRLLTLAIMPRLLLGVIPARTRHRRAPHHGFWIFDDRLVLVETVAAELTITQPREIAVYAKEFEWLAASAVYGAGARELISRAIRAIREN